MATWVQLKSQELARCFNGFEYDIILSLQLNQMLGKVRLMLFGLFLFQWNLELIAFRRMEVHNWLTLVVYSLGRNYVGHYVVLAIDHLALNLVPTAVHFSWWWNIDVWKCSTVCNIVEHWLGIKGWQSHVLIELERLACCFIAYTTNCSSSPDLAVSVFFPSLSMCFVLLKILKLSLNINRSWCLV